MIQIRIFVLFMLSIAAYSMPEGILFIVPNTGAVTYSGEFDQKRIKAALGISLQENEPIVEVKVLSQDSKIDWRFTQGPVISSEKFPDKLPVTLLSALKQGDWIEIQLFGKPVRLQCVQDTYQGIEFHTSLEAAIGRFLKHPNFYSSDEERLISIEPIEPQLTIEFPGDMIFAL